MAARLARSLVETINKKNKGANVKPFMVKNYLSVFINCMIENPAFESQVCNSSKVHSAAYPAGVPPEVIAACAVLPSTSLLGLPIMMVERLAACYRVLICTTCLQRLAVHARHIIDAWAPMTSNVYPTMRFADRGDPTCCSI